MTTIDTAEIPALLERALLERVPPPASEEGAAFVAAWIRRLEQLDILPGGTYVPQFQVEVAILIGHVRGACEERIAALESELRQLEREYRCAHCDSELKELRLRDATIPGLLEDRDRERSRREALEREVRELIALWRGLYPGVHPGYHEAAHELGAILDRAAKDSTGSGSGDDATREDASAAPSGSAVVSSPQSEPCRGYPPRTQAKPWFGDENRGRNYFYASDVVPLHEKPVAGFDEKASNEPHTPEPEPEPPCAECGGSTRLIRHTLTYDFCGDCYERLYLPNPAAPEPRMSVSEAHLNAIRASALDEAAAIVREANWQHDATYRIEKRAAAVRRGEA